jgi:hypothetical protein
MTPDLPQLLDRAGHQLRLAQIFEPLADSTLSSSLAAAAAFVCMYVGAIGTARKLRPSTVLWMCDTAATWRFATDRDQWYHASLRNRKHVYDLLANRGVVHRAWYADNSRETLRDEIFRSWAAYGALLRDESLATTSSRPQWSLAPAFAALFEPGLDGKDLTRAIEGWQKQRLGPVALARTQIARDRARRNDAVSMTLPNGDQRNLAAGDSSLILRGVVEQWAPRYLREPAVLFVSESREHLHLLDVTSLRAFGIAVRADRLLPDALILDAGDPPAFWFVEVVASDGPITESRKGELLGWARDQGIDTASCRFLTAFLSRAHAAFRKRVATLAWGSSVWFLDEPAQMMELVSDGR